MKTPLLVMAACTTGCVLGVVSTPTRNAPGSIDVATPPGDPAPHSPQAPEDPGTRIVRLSLRGLAGGGVAAGAGRAPRGSYANGIEANLSYRVDFEPGLIWAGGHDYQVMLAVSSRWYSRRAIGLNLGWLPDLEDGQPGRAYVEMEVDRMPVGLGLGYVWELSGNGRGTQATVSFGPLYLRGASLSGRGTSMVLGVDLVEVTTALAWSR